MATRNKSYSSSIIKKLREEQKSNEEFEIMINRLTLEELIWLKLELTAKLFANNKFYGFPLWKMIPIVAREALLNFALYSTSSKKDAARFLDMNIVTIEKCIDKFDIKSK